MDTLNVIKKMWANPRLFGIIVILIMTILFGVLTHRYDFRFVNSQGDVHGLYDITRRFTKISLFEYGQFPLWDPISYGGTPFYQYPQHPVFDLATLFVLLTPTVGMALGLLGLVHFFLTGLFVYLVMLELRVKPRYALFSVLVFLLNKLSLVLFITGGEYHLDQWIWLPAVFLFIIRAYRYEKWVKNSIFAGIFLSISFLAGDVSVMVSMLAFIAILFVYLLIVSYNKAKKVVFVFLVFGIVFFGLSAIRLIPLQEFSQFTELSQGRSFENSRGTYLVFEGLPKTLYKVFLSLTTEKALPGSSNAIKIGFIAFFLGVLAFSRIKNRYVLFFFITITILYVIASGGHVFYFLWKYAPGFDKQHHILRITYLVPFCFAVLAGFGVESLFDYLNKKFSRKKIITFSFYVLLMVLIVFELRPLTHEVEWFNVEGELKDNSIMQYFAGKAGEGDIFRVYNYFNSDVVGGGYAVRWGVPLGIQMLVAPLNTFEPEYIEYKTYIAGQDPTKILGIYNTKYIYGNKPINDSRLRLIREFELCDKCQAHEDDGPYLYLNTLSLPRAYIVDNAILIIGDYARAKQVMYSLLLNSDFNPSNLGIVLLDEKNAHLYGKEFFNRFKAIILLSLSNINREVLMEYVKEGGTLLPNIFANEGSIPDGKISDLLRKYQGDYERIEDVKIIQYKPNKVVMELNNQEGLMIMAEKYFMYPYWKSRDERPIFKANGISSAVFVDKSDKEIIFKFFPNSFKLGLIITLFTIFLILAYFTYNRFLITKKGRLS